MKRELKVGLRKMKTVLNSIQEVSLRLLIGLSIVDGGITERRIAAFDFISTYAMRFGASENNLNGDGIFFIAEYANRQNLVHEALYYLVRKGCVIPEVIERQMVFRVSGTGFIMNADLTSEYAESYRVAFRRVMDKFRDTSDRQVVSCIIKMGKE